ncbi:tetraacyldisaccharide 4'-kinase [Desulfotalea psychrophila]|uniref:Tetraacyldisaccharide 4'-kinase n=1 Tax=Desulfotalea psychrophila (strain LSv54 / DSM 12343) TaxID=177439 RepID=LPXK_DESPS|nr:tetraacyldisaccharide 4'-kinase [Desulfotalea psychrophila]Q6ALV8.1 RecName: Full=Tetraacyldisaccharide 4'-kinase; AltName: Full=Lipid A 4'-kinase [Desulfotalea psychrophila LSv54]CAG36667.1 related to tetraacyldisaccharide 4'-kinase (LpxK) [Desulfotalea psychrophila LSv54]
MQKKDILFSIGWPLSSLYAGIMKLRCLLYRRGLFRQHHFPVPVISVGNLTMGGTGKTPVTHYIAKLLLEHGLQPAIISRGYSGKSGGEVNIVSDGQRILLSAEQAGDEPYMLASMLAGVIVITGKKRYLSCKYAVEKMQAEVIILDDGFQHLAVARNLDLVLFDAQTGMGNNRVFPGGDLREARFALDRADAFLITGKCPREEEELLAIELELQHELPQCPLFSVYRTEGVFYSAKQEKVVTHLPKKVFAFCGIANPERFHHDLEKQGFSLVGFKAFSDHQQYTGQCIEEIVKEAKKGGAQAIITTDKDLVKIDSFATELPLYSARPRTTISTDFDELILKTCASFGE